MITIDEGYVDGLAPNAGAIKNGRDLVRQGKLIGLKQTPDGSLIFGECKGSGKSNYLCSVDFVNPDSPTSRCSCPSRQFPCKHCLGLLYAFAQNRKDFSTGEVPADIADKRGKAEARATKKKATATKPRTVNKSALKKKIGAQLEGLDLLERLTQDLIRGGIGNLNPKSAAQAENQAKQLGNAFLPGAQAALNQFAQLFGKSERVGEDTWTEAFDQLTRLHALVKQGRIYLRMRLDDPALKPDTSSAIAAWLGHAWQVQELREAGLVETDAELCQLSYSSYDDAARKELVDNGVWIDLASGAVRQTWNYRPYRAAKYIKEDDSVFHVVRTPELFVYPGDLNPRVRWESMTPRDLTTADRLRIREHARPDFAGAIKDVRGQLKTPLAGKLPLVLARFARIGKLGDRFVIEDAAGARVALADDGAPGEPRTLHLLSALPAAARSGQAILLRFSHDLNRHTLEAKPLTVVTETDILRLAF